MMNEMEKKELNMEQRAESNAKKASTVACLSENLDKGRVIRVLQTVVRLIVSLFCIVKQERQRSRQSGLQHLKLVKFAK